MKTHRNILIVSFFIGIFSLPFLIVLDKGKIYEIMLAFLTSSIIAFLLELPNYFSLKNENKSKLYRSLYSAKVHVSFLLNNIDNMKSNNIALFDKFYNQNVKDIDSYLHIFETFDNDFYFTRKKKERIINIKSNLRSSWHNINLSTLKFSIAFQKLTAEQNKMIFPTEMDNEINLIIESCYQFIKTVEDITCLVFTKEQLNNWIVDNTVLENNEINSKMSKI